MANRIIALVLIAALGGGCATMSPEGKALTMVTGGLALPVLLAVDAVVIGVVATRAVKAIKNRGGKTEARPAAPSKARKDFDAEKRWKKLKNSRGY